MTVLTKQTLRLAVLAAGIGLFGTAAASAGEWRVNPARCPEVRVEHWNHHRYEHVDHRDIRCPASAWTYVYAPGERHMKRLPPRPKTVVVYRNGRHFYRDSKGIEINLSF
ncbi:MAG: hypothetical protein GC155_14440 [Alphaproteobacteria bacterium]|nr:hypothetical protein [Alphaproteobacteria bacterium]